MVKEIKMSLNGPSTVAVPMTIRLLQPMTIELFLQISKGHYIQCRYATNTRPCQNKHRKDLTDTRITEELVNQNEEVIKTHMINIFNIKWHNNLLGIQEARLLGSH